MLDNFTYQHSCLTEKGGLIAPFFIFGAERKGQKGVKSPFDLCLTIRGMEERCILIPMDAFYESIKLRFPKLSC